MSTPVCLFISPHLDDVALSCGGYVYRLAHAGQRVAVATVVTGDDRAHQPPSRLALRCLRQWGLWDSPFAVRRQEDERALAALGAEAIHLGLLDAIYRRDRDSHPYYPVTILNIPIPDGDRTAFGTHARERLGETVRSLGADLTHIFIPLGVAGHVDHLLVRQAADQVCEGVQRVYYEEYPYAAAPGGGRPWRNGDSVPEDWSPVTIALSEEEVEARRVAIACYSSAIAFLFPSRVQTLLEIIQARLTFLGRTAAWRPAPRASLERMATNLRAYVARIGGERYWLRAGQPVGLPL